MTGRTRAGLTIAVIVVCSMLAGAAIERVAMPNFGRHRGPPQGRPSQEQDAARRTEMLDGMTKELSLTPMQRSGIDSLMRHADSLLTALRAEMRPRISSVFEESRAGIIARLDSSQRVLFAKDSARGGGRGRGRRGGGPF